MFPCPPGIYNVSSEENNEVNYPTLPVDRFLRFLFVISTAFAVFSWISVLIPTVNKVAQLLVLVTCLSAEASIMSMTMNNSPLTTNASASDRAKLKVVGYQHGGIKAIVYIVNLSLQLHKYILRSTFFAVVVYACALTIEGCLQMCREGEEEERGDDRHEQAPNESPGDYH